MLAKEYYVQMQRCTKGERVGNRERFRESGVQGLRGEGRVVKVNRDFLATWVDTHQKQQWLDAQLRTYNRLHHKFIRKFTPNLALGRPWHWAVRQLSRKAKPLFQRYLLKLSWRWVTLNSTLLMQPKFNHLCALWESGGQQKYGMLYVKSLLSQHV